MSSCKADVRPGTADRVIAAAGTLADLQAHVADYPLAGTGRDWATERARVLAAAHLAVMAPVLEEQTRLAGEIAALKGAQRSEAVQGSNYIARIKGGAAEDERERCARICEGMIIGGRAWTTEQSIAADALFAAAKNIRSGFVEPYEPKASEGVEVGETFRCLSEPNRGEVGEVTAVDDRDATALLQSESLTSWFKVSSLLDPTRFERVRAVDVAPRYEPDGNERLATAEELAVPARDVACCFCVKSGEAYALLEDGRKCPRCGKSESDLVSAECDSEWGGMEPEDSGVDDLAGPAGEERAGVPSDAAQALADMTAQRNAWEAEATRAQAQAARGRQAARARIAELEARYEAMRADVATLVQAREAFGESEDIAWPALASAIEALSQRAVSW